MTLTLGIILSIAGQQQKNSGKGETSNYFWHTLLCKESGFNPRGCYMILTGLLMLSRLTAITDLFQTHPIVIVLFLLTIE